MDTRVKQVFELTKLELGSIPTISTNTKGQPFFGWPFLLVDQM